MLIYNKTWFDNLEIQKKATKWLRNNMISKEEHAGINGRYTTEYHESSFWVRGGMFLFALVVIIAAASLFEIAIGFDALKSIPLQAAFFGCIYYAFTEYLTRGSNHFRSGVTDALLYSAIISFNIAIIFLLERNEFSFDFDYLIYYLCLLPILVITTIRFAAAFLALAAYATLFSINALFFTRMGTFGQSILPFEAMALSALVYFYIRKLLLKEELRFWKKPLFIIEIASIVSFYASGNYYVVRQLTENMLNVHIEPGNDIGLAFFFYAFTILVPLIYLWRGLKQKDYTLLRLGVILEVAGILAIRYYHSIMPVETAMIVGGIILIVVSWLSINYLKSPKHGLTYLQDDDQYDESISTISSVLISAEAGKSLQHNKGTILGGGSSGGGGAGGSF